MARYIDADLFKQCIQDNITRYFTCGTGGYFLAEDVVEDIDSFPTADVAPKSEVARLEKEVDRLSQMVLYNKVAMEIMREVRQALLNMILSNAMGENYDIEKRFAEIEKKYTEEKE